MTSHILRLRSLVIFDTLSSRMRCSHDADYDGGTCIMWFAAADVCGNLIWFDLARILDGNFTAENRHRLINRYEMLPFLMANMCYLELKKKKRNNQSLTNRFITLRQRLRTLWPPILPTRCVYINVSYASYIDPAVIKQYSGIKRLTLSTALSFFSFSFSFWYCLGLSSSSTEAILLNFCVLSFTLIISPPSCPPPFNSTLNSIELFELFKGFCSVLRSSELFDTYDSSLRPFSVLLLRGGAWGVLGRSMRKDMLEEHNEMLSTDRVGDTAGGGGGGRYGGGWTGLVGLTGMPWGEGGGSWGDTGIPIELRGSYWGEIGEYWVGGGLRENLGLRIKNFSSPSVLVVARVLMYFLNLVRASSGRNIQGPKPHAS